MSDLISREYMKSLGATCIASRSKDGTLFPIVAIDELPPADPTLPTPSNTLGALDCVDRQAAIDEIDEWIKAFRENGHKESAADACLIQDGIIQLPSAQPETAKRIVGKSRDGMTLWYQCDMCNEPVDVQDNYCRGCGRRLIDEQVDI